MTLEGDKLEKALSPDGMRSSDRLELFNAALDITSLPGTLSSRVGINDDRDHDDEMYRMTELTTQSMAYATRALSRTIVKIDSTYNSPRRHGLRNIKTRKDVFDQTPQVERAWSKTNKDQQRVMTILLRSLHYQPDEIKVYLQCGLLPRIISLTFVLYNQFFNAVRRSAHDSATPWDSGPGKAMLDHHSQELWDIRNRAHSRKFLLLESYIYLRDASAKNFFHDSLNGSPLETGGYYLLYPNSSSWSTVC
jgi:hypothetical protein